MTSETPRVPTEHGPVRGVAVEGGLEFRGIPYAGPIGGDRRFRAPVDPAPWSRTYDANAWPPLAPQPPIDSGPASSRGYEAELFGLPYVMASTEDGLYLNLWTPASDDARRPVMVWLHGGGFLFGQASRPRENGRLLSVEEDVVVVAASHRLGGTGYLDTRAALGGDANAGLLDLVHALTWIRDNVTAFGGDPGNVTLFGESGGSMKAHALLAMPAADGLFHGAICQSGLFPHAAYPGGLSPSRAERVLEAATDAVGGIDALRTVPADRLSTIPLPPGELWQPVLDESTLPTAVPQALAEGAQRGVRLMLGCNRDEMRVLAHGRALPTTRAELRARIGEGAPVEHYLGTATEGTPEFRLAAERAIAGAAFRMPLDRLAEARAAKGAAPTYVYELRWRDPARPDVGAGHGVETSLVFGNLDAVPFVRDAPGAAELSALMRRAWASFARTGTPLVGDAPWPAYDANKRATLLWDDRPEVVSDPSGAERALWAGCELTVPPPGSAT